ncbi:MAG: hypothetical protein WCK02_16130 [Bacteroidota bacterium]
MTRNFIANALFTKNYAEMHQVFKQFRIENKLDNYFENGLKEQTSGHKNMLHNKVSMILRILDQQKHFEKSQTPQLPVIGVNETPRKTSGKVKITKNPHINYDELPDDLKAIYDENTQTNGVMKSVHAKMRVSEDQSQKAECRKELDGMEVKIQANWLLIDKWYASKDDEVLVNQQPANSVADIAKKIIAAQRYVQRYDGKVKAPKQVSKLSEYKIFLSENNVKVNVR